jgi:heptose-I-phosphate ethanolaminephosphotransferase
MILRSDFTQLDKTATARTRIDHVTRQQHLPAMLLLSRALAFIAITALYFAAGWLNLEQVARFGLLGLANLLAVSAWTTRKGTETRVGKICVTGIVFMFLSFMSYHGFLREYFGVAADEDTVLGAIFSSDRSEAGEFLEQHARAIFKHAAIACVLTAVFALWLRRRPGATGPSLPPRSVRQGWVTVGVCLTLFMVVHLNRSMRYMHPLLFFPVRHAAWKSQMAQVSELRSRMARALNAPRLNTLRCADESPRTVVFLLSESITRANFPYAGYARNTTPELGAMGDLCWFSDVIASDGSTVPALCKILTPATIQEPDLWQESPDLLVMAKKAGYKTFWLSNHTTDANGVVSILASHADRVVFANRGGSRGEGSLDEVLLPLLEEGLRDPSPRKFIVLHLLGAHPAYYYRYPKSFARFNTESDSVTRELRAAGRRFWAIAMRNAYDNALLYSDHVLKRSLDLCRASGQRVAWLFAPDHGQDAAHLSNFCGHNAKARTQYEIPMIFWHSDSFPATLLACASLAGRSYQTDVLDHTLLGLMAITGDYYDSRNDILSAGFQPTPRTVRGQPWVSQETVQGQAKALAR